VFSNKIVLKNVYDESEELLWFDKTFISTNAAPRSLANSLEYRYRSTIRVVEGENVEEIDQDLNDADEEGEEEDEAAKKSTKSHESYRSKAARLALRKKTYNADSCCRKRRLFHWRRE
jgi:hypothetical protein